jgi:hypothetical protein
MSLNIFRCSDLPTNMVPYGTDWASVDLKIYLVLWIGILWMPLRILIRLSILIPIQIRILPEVFTHVGKSEKFDLFLQHCQSTLFSLSRERHRCHNFQYF